MPGCSHLDSIAIRDAPDDVAGCEACLATGGRWLHRCYPDALMFRPRGE